MYAADAELLERLAVALEVTADEVTTSAGTITSLDTAGYPVAAATAQLDTIGAWALDWAVSLRGRAGALRRMRWVSVGRPGSTVPPLDLRSWVYEDGSTQPFAAYQQQRFADEFNAYEKQTAELEEQITAFEQQAPSHYQAMALSFASRAQRRLQSDRYRELQLRLAGGTPDTAVIADIQRHIQDVAADLGLTADGFAGAAAAMTRGIPPSRAGLDPHYFPAWYVAESEGHARLHAELAAITEDHPRHPKQTGYREWLAARQELVAAIEDLDFRPPAHPDVVAWLDGPLPVTPPEQLRLVGGYLATELARAGGHDPDLMRDLSRLVGWHVTTPGAAVAMLNALDEVTLANLQQLSGAANAWDGSLHQFMAPFADALAMAGGHSELDIDIADIVDNPDAAFWFMSDEHYDVDLLIDAGTALTRVGSWDFTGASTTRDGTEWSLDPRVIVYNHISRYPANQAEALIASIVTTGDLGAFIEPEQWSTYGDKGAAAGAILALLGTGRDKSSAALIGDVMVAIGTSHPPPGVLRGGALMLLGHNGSLAEGKDGDALPSTPLRDVLDALPDRQETVTTYLEVTMGDPVAADHIYRGLSLTMARAVRMAFDPTDTDAHAEAFGDSGRLLDRLTRTHLRVALEEAGETDTRNAIWQGAFSTAIDIGSAIALMPTGGTSGFIYGVIASAGNNVGLPLVTDFGLSTNNTVNILERGFELENDFVDEAVLLLAGHLHDAGVIELPADWFVHGVLEPIPFQVWEEYRLTLETAGFPYDAWFNDVMALSGAFRGVR